MILSTLNFNSAKPLIGCGIDIEKIDRFKNWAEDPPPFIYSPEEIKRCDSLSSIKKLNYLCAIFTIKESLFKALNKPYNFNEVTVPVIEFDKILKITLNNFFCEEYKISYVNYLLKMHLMSMIITEVYVF